VDAEHSVDAEHLVDVEHSVEKSSLFDLVGQSQGSFKIVQLQKCWIMWFKTLNDGVSKPKVFIMQSHFVLIKSLDFG
jgi:hypothetical protein